MEGGGHDKDYAVDCSLMIPSGNAMVVRLHSPAMQMCIVSIPQWSVYQFECVSYLLESYARLKKASDGVSVWETKTEMSTVFLQTIAKVQLYLQKLISANKKDVFEFSI